MKTIPTKFRKGRYDYELLSRTHGYPRNTALYMRRPAGKPVDAGYEVFYVGSDGEGGECLPDNYDYGRRAWKFKNQADAWAKFASLERCAPVDAVEVPEWAISRLRTRMALDDGGEL